MLYRLWTTSLALSLLLFSAAAARAHAPGSIVVVDASTDCAAGRCGHHHALPSRHEERASTFQDASRGLFAGALAGLGVGYLVAREGGGGLQQDAWRPLVFASGVGALSGAALGLTLGMLEGPRLGTGHYVTRDMLYGVTFGALTGTIAGGLSVVLGGDGDHVPTGAAIGAAAGVGIGALTGLLWSHRAARYRADAKGRSVALVPAACADRWGATVQGRF